MKLPGYVLHITSWYPTKVNAFDGDFIQRHIECLRNSVNQEVIHIQINPGHKKYSPEIIHEIRNGVSTTIAYVKKVPLSIRGVYYKKIFRYVFSKLNSSKGLPGIIHCHATLPASMLGHYLYTRYGIPYVITEHSTIFDPDNNVKGKGIKLWLAKKWLDSASYIFPVSANLKGQMKNHTDNTRFSVVHNVVPSYFFNTEMKPDISILRILHVSSFDDRAKNITGLIRVLANLKKMGGEFRATLIGSSNIQNVIDKVNSCGLMDSISVKGPMDHKEIAIEMSNNDVFVLFSNFENLPCVLLEAMASGVYIVSTPVGGIPEIVSGDDLGVLVDRSDEKGLFSCLESMLESQLDFDRSYLRDVAAERYSQAKVASQFTNHYRTLVVH